MAYFYFLRRGKNSVQFDEFMRLGTGHQDFVLTTVWCILRLEMEQNDSTAHRSTAPCALPL